MQTKLLFFFFVFVSLFVYLFIYFFVLFFAHTLLASFPGSCALEPENKANTL